MPSIGSLLQLLYQSPKPPAGGALRVLNAIPPSGPTHLRRFDSRSELTDGVGEYPPPTHPHQVAAESAGQNENRT